MKRSLTPSRLVIVSYRLPFRVVDGRLERNAGGLVSAMLAYALGVAGQHEQAAAVTELLWIGCSSNTPEELAAAERGRDMEGIAVQAVPLDRELDAAFYGGFCNDLIWPLFHYFPSMAGFEPHWWTAYQAANEAFATACAAVLQPGDRVWIHDYHLACLPRMLRSSLPTLSIGFFLHIPFPDFEVLRLMPRPWRRELLHGLLGADLIGLHTFDYVRHFLAAVAHSLPASLSANQIQLDGAVSRVEAFPISVDTEALAQRALSPLVQQLQSDVRAGLGDVKLVLSVDRMDYSKGLLKRVQAIELFLTEHPSWHGKVVFHMVVVPSRDAIESYQILRRDLERALGRINGLFATLHWRPIAYQYRGVPMDELVALYRAADVALVTPLRDGMNLVAKEYVVTQNPEQPGVLILSEMAGAAAELKTALLINPNDQHEVADAIVEALEMPLADRKMRWKAQYQRLVSYDVFAWAADFLSSQAAASDESQHQRAAALPPESASAIVSAFAAAAHRTLFLDYDGTLVGFQVDPAAASPSEELLAELRQLAAVPECRVVVVSGRDRAFLEHWLGALQVDLVAEHGAFERLVGRNWVAHAPQLPSWWADARAVVDSAAKRCPGALVEVKTTALVWHYRNADPLYASLRAERLRTDLQEVMGEFTDFQIVMGNHIVELRPTTVHKGAAALRLLGQQPSGFVLAAGDDRTDEDLFAALGPGAVSIRVGPGLSLARFHARDPAELRGLLRQLVATQVPENPSQFPLGWSS